MKTTTARVLKAASVKSATLQLVTSMNLTSAQLFQVQKLTWCSKCGAELKDAASVNFGIGPECRKKANHILATELPCNLDNVALDALLLSIHAEDKPEPVRAAYLSLQKAILEPVVINGSIVKRDWRDVVGLATQLCSTEQDRGVRQSLYQIITALGYPAYANYLSGVASANADSCYLFIHNFTNENKFVGGKRLCFSGVRNSAGNDKIRSIVGRAGHSQEVTNTTVKPSGKIDFCWSVEMSRAEELVRVVAKYWPLTVNLSEFVNIYIQRPQQPVQAAPVIELVKEEVTIMTDKQNALIAALAKKSPQEASLFDGRVIGAVCKAGYAMRSGQNVIITSEGNKYALTIGKNNHAVDKKEADAEIHESVKKASDERKQALVPTEVPTPKEEAVSAQRSVVADVVSIFPGAAVTIKPGTAGVKTSGDGTNSTFIPTAAQPLYKSPKVTRSAFNKKDAAPVAPKEPKASGTTKKRERVSPALIAFVHAVKHPTNGKGYICNAKGFAHHDGMVVRSALSRGLVTHPNEFGYVLTDAGQAFIDCHKPTN